MRLLREDTAVGLNDRTAPGRGNRFRFRFTVLSDKFTGVQVSLCYRWQFRLASESMS